jgi:hypothetical protein
MAGFKYFTLFCAKYGRVYCGFDGRIRGFVILENRSAPKAAREDQALYELLVLIDALRGGRAREREAAAAEIENRLKAYEKSKS